MPELKIGQVAARDRLAQALGRRMTARCHILDDIAAVVRRPRTVARSAQ